jgi:hypothetical protein
MITAATPRMDYTGNGATTVYAFTFRIEDASELRVVKRDTSTPPVETPLVLTTDYTVSGVGVDLGGSITLTTVLPLNYKLTILGVPAASQETDFQNQGSFYPKLHEKAFDKVTRLCQRIAEQITRCVLQPETEAGSSYTLPAAAQRANQFLGFDANGAPIAAQPSNTVVSSFMQTVLDDADAATARSTLGFTGTGGTAATGNIQDLAVTAQKVGSGSAALGQMLQADGAGGASFRTLDGSADLRNLGLSASVATNALTVAMKTKAGTDPTLSDAAVINFRSSTSTTGTYNRRTVTGALSLTIPSGTTIGTANGAQAYIYVYALDNGGTVELGVSLSLFDEGSVQNTTAISGGSAGTVLYSQNARTGVPVRLIGRLTVTETTAGTWASAPSEASPTPLRTPGLPTIQKFTVTGITTGSLFTISTSTTCAVGDTYTNGGQTFTVLAALSAQTGAVLFTSQTGSPAAGGTLTRATGSGTASITYTAAQSLGTYTTPANVKYLRVRMMGGGGGGAPSGTASFGAVTAGGSTYFGANLLVANGGFGAVGGNTNGAVGGSASLGTGPIGIAFTGTPGGGCGAQNTTGTQVSGGMGGVSPFGGAGTSGPAGGPGGSAVANSGSGGGGAGTSNTAGAFGGAGGGAGGFVDAIITNPAVSYPYLVAALGGGGSAGTSGFAGGNGGTGIIVVEEYYQ